MTSENEKIRQCFTQHLNRLYCAESHLIERLDEIDHIADIGIREVTIDVVKNAEGQIVILDKICGFLNTKYSFESCPHLVNFLEESFGLFHTLLNDPYLKHIIMAAYLKQIEAICISSGKVLKTLAAKLGSAEISSLIGDVDNYNDNLPLRNLAGLYDNRTII